MSCGTRVGKFHGRVAVITGATSGMALATAKLFVEQGAYVFITGRRQEKLDEAVKAIGRNVTGVQGDGSNLHDLDRLFETVKREKGKIDVLFCSVGTGSAATIHEVTEEHFDTTFNTNVRSTLFTVQKALPLLVDRASVILNGSVAATKGIPSRGVYAASKAALRALARAWVNELKDRKIRINVLSAGPIQTEMWANVSAEETKQISSLVPVGRMGSAEEVAPVALFLASDDSTYVNGVDLAVDGGMTAV